MDIKVLIEVLSKNLIALVVVVIAFAGGVYYLIDGFRDLMDKRQELSEQIQAFEAVKSNFKVKQVEKEYELKERLSQVARREDEADKRSDDLDSRDKAYSKAFSDLQRKGEILGKEQQSKDTQDKIEHLIAQFADLGVNLYDNPMCSDKDDVRRYNSAKAIFSTIKSLATQNFMTGRYSEFINKHRGRDYIDCR